MAGADITIKRYKNSFCIYSRHTLIMNAIGNFAEQYRQPTMRPKNNRRPAWMQQHDEKEKRDEFFIFSKQEHAYYFINKVWSDLSQFLASSVFNFGRFSINDIPYETFIPATVEFDRHTLLMEESEDSDFFYQNEIVDFICESDRSHAILEVQTGKGKALKSTTPIRIPDGWRDIGTILVGDSVIARDGSVTKVTGVYPQGVVELYRVTFDDGRYVDCCSEHLWEVRHNGVSRILNTGTIRGMSDIRVPLCEPENSKVVSDFELMYRQQDDVWVATSSYDSHLDDVTIARAAGYITIVSMDFDGIWTVTAIRPEDNCIGITSIIKVESAEAHCITIDHPEALYVADEYIVTHNTAMAMKAMVKLKTRVFMLTKAGYLPKWTSDLTATERSLSLKPGELIRIKTSSNLDDLVDMSRNKQLDGEIKGTVPVKLILCSSHTFENWIMEYHSKGMSDYNPINLMRDLKIGLLSYDETHQLFKKNYWSYMLLGCNKTLDLSATLIPDKEDIFIADRYMERLPMDARYNGLEFDKYIDAYSIYYSMSDKTLVRKINRLSMYNHTEFEKAILTKGKYTRAYFDMIYEMMTAWYFNKYQDGQRCLVFFSTKRMCTDFTAYIKEKRPSFNVKRYIEGDNYKEFITADVGISTPGKSGTAVDIPGLVISFVTPAISKGQANLQILGRTRKDRKWGIAPRVVFLHCRQIRKHLDYLKKRQELFKEKVNKFDILNSRFSI